MSISMQQITNRDMAVALFWSKFSPRGIIICVEKCRYCNFKAITNLSPRLFRGKVSKNEIVY